VASNGCKDSSLTFTRYIQVDPAPPTPIITPIGNTLYCSTDPKYVSYQWFDDSTLIVGATDTFLVISHNGNYNLQVTSANGCKVAVGINIVGVQNLAIRELNIYPDPVKDYLQLDMGDWQSTSRKMTLDIFNLVGQKVFSNEIGRTTKTINVSGLSQGLYYLRLQADGESVVQKFVKE